MRKVQGGEAGGLGPVESVSVGFLLEDGRQHRVGEVSAFTACRGGQAGDCGGVPVGGGVLAAAVTVRALWTGFTTLVREVREASAMKAASGQSVGRIWQPGGRP